MNNIINAAAPIQSKLDQHDVFAVMLPGSLFVMIVGTYAYLMGWLSFNISEDNLPNVLLVSCGVLIFAYAIGDFLQIVGRISEGALWTLHGGSPYYWLIAHQGEDKPRRSRIVNLFRTSNFLPLATQKLIVSSIEKEHRDSLAEVQQAEFQGLTPEILDAYFARIKGMAYTIGTFKESCTYMLSKAHMYRGYCAIMTICVFSTLTHLIYVCCSSATVDCRIPLAFLALSCICLVFSIKLFRHYTIKFNRYLFEGYRKTLVDMEKGKHEEFFRSIANTPQQVIIRRRPPSSPSDGAPQPPDTSHTEPTMNVSTENTGNTGTSAPTPAS